MDRNHAALCNAGWRPLSRPVLVAALSVLLGACNQLDPPDLPICDGGCFASSSSDAGTDRAGLSADFFPMADGNRWVYRHTGAAYWEEKVTMSAAFSDGVPGFAVTDTPGPSGTFAQAFWVRAGPKVLRTHKDVLTGEHVDESVDYAPGFMRFDSDWLDREVGDVDLSEYRRTVVFSTVVPMPSLEPEDRAHQYTVLSTDEPVRVPAGDFEGCLKIRRQRIRGGEEAVGSADVKMFWFCPGVGKVKEMNLSTPGEGIEELLSFDVSSEPVGGGHDALVRLTRLPDDPEREHCPFGGTLLEAGTDNGDGGATAGDGVLSASEVDSSSYVCDGRP